jgi:NAD(P)-dependent dehydrogenase (short-subunit alcohol dehydrogenase family)
VLLENKNAAIYGAGGAVGGAVARAFAREGAKVFLTGRTLASVAATAKDIAAAGGVAETAQVDVLDLRAWKNTSPQWPRRLARSTSPSTPLNPFRSRERRKFPSPSCRSRASRLPSRRICDPIS